MPSRRKIAFKPRLSILIMRKDDVSREKYMNYEILAGAACEERLINENMCADG